MDSIGKGFCRNATYSVQISEKLKENGSSARNTLDASIISKSELCEKTWMLKLRKLYPYDLNDPVGDEFKEVDTHVLVGNKFPLLLRKHSSISCGTSNKNNYYLTPD